MESLFWAALNNAAVASLLAVAAALVARVCHRPAVVHALWLLVLLKLLTPPLVALPVMGPRSIASPPLHVAAALSPDVAVPSPSLAESSEEAVAPEPDLVPETPACAVAWSSIVMAVWLGGSLAWWMVAGGRMLRFHRLLQASRPVPETVQEQARELAAMLGLRRCPPVAFVAAPLSPMLWALGFSPRLLVPVELWRRLSVEQQDTLLAHELAHLRRGDHWVRRLEFIVLGLYWWHPVVWWARRRLQEAEEECCDARVLAVLPEAASAYASVLVETVAFLSQTRAAALLGASGAGQVPLLKRRLTMILTAAPRKSPRVAFWCVLGLGGLILPLTPGAAQPEAAEPVTPPAVAEAQPPTGFRGIGLQFHTVQQQCAGCHQPGSVQEGDLRRKPRTWQEAHDEMVRKMDDLMKKQAILLEARKEKERREDVASLAKQEAEKLQRAEQAEKLRDEIELLKVQVELKRAYLEAAKADALAAEKTYRRLQAEGSAVSGMVLNKAEAELASQKAQIRIREAELQEPMVRLRQVERRLARLVEASQPAAPARTREQQEQRLRELEQKVKQLLDEMKTLQKELRPQKPGTHSSGTNFDPFNPNVEKPW